MFWRLYGEPTFEKVILVTNMWGEVSPDVGEARENELITDIFRPVLDKGVQLARHHNTVRSAHDIVQRITKHSPVSLRAQREPAYKSANREPDERTRHHLEELTAIREEMLQALKEKDEETRRELEQETRRLQEQMRAELAQIVSFYEEKGRRMEAEMRRWQEEARVERERLIDCLNSCLRQCPRCR